MYYYRLGFALLLAMFIASPYFIDHWLSMQTAWYWPLAIWLMLAVAYVWANHVRGDDEL